VKKHLFCATLISFAVLANTLPASAQAKSCYDQWFELRQKRLNSQGQPPAGRAANRALRPSMAAREDIATCEASADKKFRPIKSARVRA
jgi:hypothetical protein